LITFVSNTTLRMGASFTRNARSTKSLSAELGMSVLTMFSVVAAISSYRASRVVGFAASTMALMVQRWRAMRS